MTESPTRSIDVDGANSINIVDFNFINIVWSCDSDSGRKSQERPRHQSSTILHVASELPK